MGANYCRIDVEADPQYLPVLVTGERLLRPGCLTSSGRNMQCVEKSAPWEVTGVTVKPLFCRRSESNPDFNVDWMYVSQIAV